MKVRGHARIFFFCVPHSHLSRKQRAIKERSVCKIVLFSKAAGNRGNHISLVVDI